MNLSKIAVAIFSLISIAALAGTQQSTAGNGNVIAGYLDITATGSAAKVQMKQAAADGYNMVIFGFADVNGTSVAFHNDTDTIAQQQLKDAKNNNIPVLISFGGQVNTFNPGVAGWGDIDTLAQNMVNFAKNNGFAGIDFDLESPVDANNLYSLIKAIKDKDSNLIISAAPQINNGRLVTTGTNEDYYAAIDDNLFDYLFLQEYNTGPENDSTFIHTIYPTIKSQLPTGSKTKLVTGEPTDSSAVTKGAAAIYYPSTGKTLTTEEVTALMLPELKQINADANYGGVMGWSLNVDYDSADYGNPDHTPGSYAYGLKDCVTDGQCDTPPTPQPKPATYNIEITNTGSSANHDDGFNTIISDGTGVFLSDYLSPTGTPAPAIADKTYNESSNPAATSIEKRDSLRLFYTTYPNGPAGICGNSFALTSNIHVMLKVDSNGNATCDIQKL